ncbi:NAD(P)-dependent oxidoreductase [Arthrobacter sp. ERGS1:01]|uniref:NAD(P)-dependent oxidoreductase n=1 Tax=Arthrobacter sp. ERGS1:01 TaxID=1704044 RepID=UPI0006B48B18|nr:NAD(P)H-binding protein [Arthrobacter sp. ERGS1:01]
MNITVIGASAGVGLATVHAALSRGHRVTTLSRSVDALPAAENLTVVQGTATSVDDVRRVTASADEVLVTLGTKKLGTTTLFSDATAALLETMTGRRTPVIVVTGFGIGDSAQFQNPVARIFMNALLGRMYADKARMEEILTATSLQWEIVRPGILSNNSTTGTPTGITSLHKGMKVPGSAGRTSPPSWSTRRRSDATPANSSCPSSTPSGRHLGGASNARNRRGGGGRSPPPSC